MGNCKLMVFALDGELPEHAPATHVPWIYVDDLDAHLARAQANGATIVEEIHQHGYRAYTADDLEGHRWTIAQARPTMSLDYTAPKSGLRRSYFRGDRERC